MLRAAKSAAALGADGKGISDTGMADQLSNLQNGEPSGQQSEQAVGRKGRMSEGKHVKSMRESRSKPHRTGKDHSSISKSGHKRKRKQAPQ